MSTHSQQQTEIMQTCQRINEMLQIPGSDFSLQALTHIDWYLQVLELIYPQLGERFEQIRAVQDQSNAIDQLLFMLTKQEIIEEDFLEIKGRDIIEGDVQSVYYIVQLLNALIERQAEENQQQQEADQGEEQSENQQAHQHAQPHRPKSSLPDSQAYSEPDQYSNDFQEPLESSNPTPHKPQIASSPAQNLPRPNDMFRNVFNQYDSQDEPSHQEERHSVLGIHNQFEDQEEDDENDEDIAQKPLTSQGKNSYNNATFGEQQSLNHQLQPQSIPKPSQPTSNQASIFPDPSYKPHELVDTGYKMTKPQKQFPSSSSEQVNFYQQPSKNPQKKISKPSKGSKDQTEEEDDNEYFINPTIKKYKSDAKLVKTAGSASKKSTMKKNLTKYSSPVAESKQSRKLVSHPTIKKQYRKAGDPFAKKLTQQVKTQVSTILKKKKQPLHVPTTNPAGHQIQRKARELKVKLADWKKESRLQEKRRLRTNTTQGKSSVELAKVLNWREGQLKREKVEFEKAMEIKLQGQKQAYVKKINALLVHLQKEKELHERQQYKQHLLKENQQAAKRLTAIEHWYKDRIAMLKQSNCSNRNERKLMHTGHKEILKHIEKELKRENQKQIMAITMKYRRQEAQVENDLEELEREIIKVYKSH